MSNARDISRRRVLGVACAAAMGVGASRAQESFPTRAVTLVVPFTAGGVVDVIARSLQPGLTKALGQPVVVSNRPGAAGAIGAAVVANGPADGYTLLVTMSNIAALPEQARVNGHRPLFRLEQLQLIARLTTEPVSLVVRADSPLQSLSALIARLKGNSDSLAFASSGNYGATHLPAQMLLKSAGVRAVHVPFQGGAAMIVALLSGQVDFAMLGRNFADPHVKAGRLRYLAVVDAQRWQGASDIPTVAEVGYHFDYVAWSGAYAPIATPALVLERWRTALSLAIADPAFVPAAGPPGSHLDGPRLAEFARRDAVALQRAVQDIGPLQ